MNTSTTTLDKLYEEKELLSYISSEEKYGLVGSFVVDNYWETFNEEKYDAIDKFRKIAKDSVHAFIDAYEDVWNFVVDINRLDDIFLCERIEKNKKFQGLSYEELKTANKLLSLSLYSELEKDCLMALNKNILGELADDLSKKHGFTEEQFQLLMTPSFETFFTKYHFAHLEYALTENAKSKEQQRLALINNFHAKDPALFELRFADMYFPKDDMAESLSSHKKALVERSAKKNELIADRDELVAFERLLKYDNFLDFEFRYNLQACPEYYLRKMLFKDCQENGIFTDYSNPLALKDSEFIDGVIALINIRASKYTITLDPSFDINDSDSLSDIDKIAIDGSKEEILRHLKQGFPCVASNTDSGEKVIIVGYDNDTILAQNGTNEQFKLDASKLGGFNEFYILQKRSKDKIEAFTGSINKLIERTPYLNRADYEHGF